MRRTRHVVLPVKSWQYMGLMVVSLACLTLGLVSRDRGGRSGSLAGPELMHTAPHEVDACPNSHPFGRLPPYDESALEQVTIDDSDPKVRALVRARTTRDSRSIQKRSNDRTSRSDRRLEAASRMSRERNIDSQTRRSMINDRKIRAVEMSRIQDVRSSRQTSPASRSLDVGSKSSWMSRENRGNIRDYRTVNDRHTRESNKGVRQFNDRSSSSRSLELRESSPLRESRMNVQNQHSSSTDRKTREMSEDERSRRQRLMSRSYDRQSSDRRADHATRIYLNKERNIDRRMDNSERRRNIRSINARDVREDRVVRISRLRENQAERRTNGPRSDERFARKLVEGQQRRIERLTERSADVNRMDVRVRSQERTERREIERHEHREGLIRRSVQSRLDVRRTRSEDVDRADARRMGIRSQERRFVKQQEKNSMEHRERRVELVTRLRPDERRTSDNRVVNIAERREKRVNHLVRSDVRRQASRRNTDLVDLSRVRVPSGESKSTERREINSLQHQETRIDKRSRDVQISRSPDVTHLNLRRQEVRSQERRFTARRELGHLERTERRTSRLARHQERQERITELSGRSQIRRSSEQRELERRQMPLELSQRARSEELRRPRMDVRQRSWADSLRRNVRNSRTSRNTDVERHERRASVRDASQERRGVRDVFQQPRERLVVRDAIQERRAVRDISQERGVHRMVRDVSQTRRERIAIRNVSQERRERLAARDVSQERRERLAVRDVSQTRRERIAGRDVSQERRERLAVRDVSQARRERLAVRDVSQERRERLAVRGVSQARRERLAVRDVSQERRERLAARDVSHRREDRVARDVSQERRERLAVHDIIQQHRERLPERATVRKLRASNESRTTSRTRELWQTSRVDSSRKNMRTSIGSRTTISKHHERLLNRDISQERRGRLGERRIVHELQTSSQERRTSRANDRVDSRRERKMVAREIRTSRGENNRDIANERSRVSFMNIPDFTDIRKTSNNENMEYLRQALVLILCAAYGASLLKRKGGFYSFRDILTQTTRFAEW